MVEASESCGLRDIVAAFSDVPDSRDMLLVKMVGLGLCELLDTMNAHAITMERLCQYVSAWVEGTTASHITPAPTVEQDYSNHQLDKLVQTLSDTLENDPIGFEAVPHAILPAIMGSGIQEIRAGLLRSVLAIENIIALANSKVDDGK